ncbi:MAG: hypothetical protein JWN46_2608 [Acidimicrobiales bacterium]|nr:hypothetical protein [Acidimicrobiales bacterium]
MLKVERRSPLGVAGHAVLGVGRQLAREVDHLAGPAVRAKKRTRTTGALAVLSALGLVLLSWAHRGHSLMVEHVSVVRAELPLHVEIARLPASLLSPAPRLPLWGALAQVLLVFWLAELNLGRRLALLLIAVYHASATLAGRVMIQVGPTFPLHLGVKHHLVHARDTGPSAAVVGLCAYLSIVCHAPVLGAVVWLAMIGEILWHPDLAGREHLVGMAVGALTAVPVVVQRRRRAATLRRATAASAAPPIAGSVGASAEGSVDGSVGGPADGSVGSSADGTVGEPSRELPVRSKVDRRRSLAWGDSSDTGRGRVG